MNKEEELIDRLIDLAFAEDIGDGDHTTLSCIPATAMGKSKLLIKEAGILAGIEVAKEVFRRFDPTMKVEVFINDGTEVKPGDVAMVVEGKVQSLGVVGIASYIGAGLQDVMSGILIEGQKTVVNGTDVYDFTYINWFWIGASLLSTLLALLVWNAKADAATMN